VERFLYFRRKQMSSPTINVGQSSGNTSLQTIMNLVRSIVNDTQAGATSTPGEGQILTDNPAISPFTQPFLNSAIREVYRELRNNGQPTLIKDNVIILGLTPVFSPTYGLAAQDPAVQVYLGFGGYFDGNSINSNLLLPSDMIAPLRVYERQTGTNNQFAPMTQPQFGLPSIKQQNYFGLWEWRNDNIWMCGATETRDLRLRYTCSLPQFFSDTLDFNSTFVPIIDCVDAVAYKTAVKYAQMLGSPGLAELKEEAKAQMFQLKNSNVRRAQTVNYMRDAYGIWNNYIDSWGGQ
jgi:hypothetical protein